VAWISAFKLRQAAHFLRCGEIIAYPTEAVYGLGCDPLNADAIQRILELKQRPVAKGMILIAANFQQIEDYIEIDDVIKKRVTLTWPGPHTWVLPAQPWVPEYLTGEHQTLAVRITDHPIATKICEHFGQAIVSTSANPSGLKPPKTLLQLRKYFSPQDLLMLPGTTGALNQPTTIRNAVTGERLR
jgi:L-threonylcarbamoyladenylate synthase